MNTLYYDLVDRFITEKISPLTYNIYFFREYMKKFTREEIYQIFVMIIPLIITL